jgi:hypothetical protein
MRVSNNIHNIACLDEAEFCQEWTEEEKIPIKASPITVPPPKKEEEKKAEEPKAEGDAAAAEGAPATDAPKDDAPAAEEAKPVVIEAEQKFEIRKKTKKNFTKLKFSSSSFALAPNVRRDFKDLEDNLSTGDAEILERKELRNALEAYSYEMRNNLDSYGTLEKYLNDTDRAQMLKDITFVIEWIYGDGENASAKEYTAWLEKFKDLCGPAKSRHFYYSELDIYYAQWEKINERINVRLVEIVHLTEGQVKMINEKQLATLEFI